MRRTSLLLGALLLSSRAVSAQIMTTPPSFRPPAQTAFHPETATNPTLLSSDQKTPPVDAMQVAENLTTFDGTRAQLIWQEQTWKLVAEGVVIKDFGRRESDARQAQRLIHDLHLTQHGTVGTPVLMEYWLSDGHAPTGFVSGMRTLSIDPASLKVEQSHGQWVVRDRQRVWFNFGVRGDEAGQALGVMKKHGFTQVATVGMPTPTMMVFLGNPVRPGAGAASYPAPPTAPSDAAAALAGYVPATLPPLHYVAAQPNQPTSAFHHEPVETLSASHPTSFLRGAPPEAPGLTERVAFDWRQAQVRKDLGHWKVTAGSHVLADFGANQNAAAEALKAVQFYHFTEQCQVGQPSPYCSYFLVSGQAPRGIPFGVQGQPIDVVHLAVQQVGNKYALVSGSQTVLQFGPRPDEARHMLDVIQRHQFDRVCHVGGPEEEGMTFLVKAQ